MCFSETGTVTLIDSLVRAFWESELSTGASLKSASIHKTWMGKRIPSQSKLKSEQERMFLLTIDLFFSARSVHPIRHLAAAIQGRCSASLVHEHFSEHLLLCFWSTFVHYGAFGCSSYLSWLTLCVNLTGLRGAQIAGKTLFLDVSGRVSMKEISI